MITSFEEYRNVLPSTECRQLGLQPDDIACDLPRQVVSTGAPHLLIPVRDREAIDRIQPARAALLPILQSLDAEGCYAFSLDPRQPRATAYARFFNPTAGITEDPMTGTAAGPLAAYLTTNNEVHLPGRGHTPDEANRLSRCRAVDERRAVETLMRPSRAPFELTGGFY